MKKRLWLAPLAAAIVLFNTMAAFADPPGGPEDPPGDGQPHTHETDGVWHHDDTQHWMVCTTCLEQFNAGKHEYTAAPNNDGTHALTCSTCGYTKTENCHGGTATCTSKAVCAACGQPYGTLGEHALVQKSDETGHWMECTQCPYRTEREPHAGGTATCTSKAVCAACGREYGELGGHTYVMNFSETEHWMECSVCGDEKEHAPHAGGTATCQDQAVCTACGAKYGELGEHTFTVTNHDDKEHWSECAVCGEQKKHEAHSGGKATCSQQAVCAACGAKYGEVAAHDFSVVKSDGAYHWKECSMCGTQAEKVAHSGGTATCVERATCDVCGAKYGERAAHRGGTATCNKKATCEVCGSSYGDYAPHTPGDVWRSDDETHWHNCTVCNARIDSTLHTEDGGRVVTKPTANAAGLKAYSCTVCGRQLRTEYIPATGAASSSSSSEAPSSSSSSSEPSSAPSSSSAAPSSSSAPDSSGQTSPAPAEPEGRLNNVILIIAGCLLAAAGVCGIIMAVNLRRR